MNKLLGFSVFVLCISFAYGLKCYMCNSKDSFDECDKKRNETACSAGYDHCVKAGITGKLLGQEVKSYAKGCAIKAQCDNKENLCKLVAAAFGVTDAKCDVYCCERDLCNGGEVPLVSFIVLSACTLTAFIR